MPAILHHMPESPPARAVVLLIRYLGLTDIELKLCNIQAGETKTPEFLKKNPQGTVPFLEDNGLYLSESRAILFYLVDSRAPESGLLGRFPKRRAIIHQRLHYELGSIGPAAGKVFGEVMSGKVTVVTEEHTKDLYEKLNYIEQILADKKSPWIAGDSITIADFSYLAGVATFVVSHNGHNHQMKKTSVDSDYSRISSHYQNILVTSHVLIIIYVFSIAVSQLRRDSRTHGLGTSVAKHFPVMRRTRREPDQLEIG